MCCVTQEEEKHESEQRGVTSDEDIVKDAVKLLKEKRRWEM